MSGCRPRPRPCGQVLPPPPLETGNRLRAAKGLLRAPSQGVVLEHMPCPPPTYCLQVTIQGTGAPTRPARALWAPAVGGDQPPRFTDEETEAGPSRATPEPRCSASLTSQGTKLWGPRSMGTGRGRWGLGRAGGKGRLRRSPPEGPAWAGHWPVPQFLSLSCEDEGTQWIHPPPPFRLLPGPRAGEQHRWGWRGLCPAQGHKPRPPAARAKLGRTVGTGPAVRTATRAAAPAQARRG